jgi:hypothetical protein
MTHAVTGTGLISLARDFADAPKSTMVAAAGYVRPDGKLAWTSFYEALLAAKGILPSQQAVTADEDDDYAELSEDAKALYDEIHDRVGEKWSHVEIMDFLGEVQDLGIERADQFGDALAFVSDDGWHWQRDFVEDLMEQLGESVPDYVVVDHEATWNSALSYDYTEIEYDGSVYVFRRDF